MEISFTHISTFLSLIYGLALAHALSCIAEYIQHFKEIKHYWVWWTWATYLLLFSVETWIVLYLGWSSLDMWHSSFTSIVTLQACLFYLMFYIFFNHFHELRDKNLELSFLNNRRIFFILFSIQVLPMDIILFLITTDMPLAVILSNSLPEFIQSTVLVFLAFSENKFFQGIFCIAFICLFLIQIIFSPMQ